MTVSTETRAYLQELEAHDAAADHDGTDHTQPSQPPTSRSNRGRDGEGLAC